MTDSANHGGGSRGTPPSPPPRLPLYLLGLLSIVTFAGPFVILVLIRGGDRPEWPPDRPIESWAFWGISTVAAVLMVACLASGIWARRRSHGP